jgi:hypothetical protein
MAAGVDPGGMSNDWIDRIWLDPRRRMMTDGGPPAAGGGLLSGALGTELGLLPGGLGAEEAGPGPTEPPAMTGARGAELGLLIALCSRLGAGGAAVGGADGGRMLEGVDETAGIDPVLCDRRSSSESAGSPTTWSAASSTARARATSPG